MSKIQLVQQIIVSLLITMYNTLLCSTDIVSTTAYNTLDHYFFVDMLRSYQNSHASLCTALYSTFVMCYMAKLNLRNSGL